VRVLSGKVIMLKQTTVTTMLLGMLMCVRIMMLTTLERVAFWKGKRVSSRLT